MNVLLVQPPAYLSKFRELGQKQLSANIGLAYIASYIRGKGIKVSIYDANVSEFRVSDFKDVVLEKRPDIVGISAFTTQISDAGYIAELIKSIDRGIVTVIGGAHASAIPEQTLEEFGSFDFAVVGEGEETFYELILYLSGKGAFDDRGLCYREDGHIKRGGSRPLIEDIDNIPMPAFDLFPLEHYKPQYSHNRGLSLPLLTTRGCPYGCTFCSGPIGRKIRFRSTGGIIDELKALVSGYRPHQILIADDTFTVNKPHVIELCNRIAQEGIGREVEFICETRVDLVDTDILESMKRAGFRSVSFGIESGDDSILERAMKKITREEARSAVTAASRAGLEVDGNFILGLPYDSRETIMKTIDFACSLPLDYASFFLLVPYPGTEAARMAENNEGGLILLTRDWTRYGKQTGGVLALSGMSYNRLKVYQLYAYFRFYLYPRRFLNILKRVTPWTIALFMFQMAKTLFKKK
ncbi:MAG: B12-binding domain-containing radical SAM protein [Deltaproteobacteria bacterium]|nr:B12-binding domain-containing radical SAM protein [Deltaproteobacteria bacterium]